MLVLAGHIHVNENVPSEDIIVEITPNADEGYLINSIWIDASNLTAQFTIRMYHKIDGSNYVEIPLYRVQENSGYAYQWLSIYQHGSGPIEFDKDWKITVESAGGSAETDRALYYRIPYTVFYEYGENVMGDDVDYIDTDGTVQTTTVWKMLSGIFSVLKREMDTYSP